MSARWLPERVLVYRHPVDMRKQIDGLSELIAAEFDQNPADRQPMCLSVAVLAGSRY